MSDQPSLFGDSLPVPDPPQVVEVRPYRRRLPHPDLNPAAHLATRKVKDGGLEEPAGHWPLKRLRKWLQSRRDAGVVCPVCDQFAKVYRRPITGTSAVALIVLFREYGREFAHMPTVLAHSAATRGIRSAGGDEAKLVYWGLIEAQPGERADGSRRNGWWRVTDDGVDFVHGTLSVQQYALVYASKCIGLDGPLVTIRDCLGTKFDYAALMAGDL